MFDFDNMFENIEKIQPSRNKFGPDPRFWKLSRNDDDVGLARIRLLPSKAIKDGVETTVPYVKVYKYNINLRPFGAKKFAEIESAEGLEEEMKKGRKVAVVELRKELHKIGTEEAKKVMDILKRSERYISNIYVVQDPIKTENTGRVALWEYGVKLKDKFLGWLHPSPEDVAMGASPLNIWLPDRGADIKLVMRKTGGFYNYDDTTHYDPTPLMGGDQAKLDEIYAKMEPLTEWLDPNHYMSFDKEVDKLLWLFEGTKVEDILKGLGVSLYKGIKADNTTIPPVQSVSNKTSEASNATANITTNEAKQETTSTQSTLTKSVDDDLDFLDDI